MRKELVNYYKVWEKWFAWYPIHVGWTRVWWEHVERRLVTVEYDTYWEYRFINDGERTELKRSVMQGTS